MVDSRKYQASDAVTKSMLFHCLGELGGQTLMGCYLGELRARPS